MAGERRHTSRENVILADSNQAKKRFGFGGESERHEITKAPKFSDMFFVELRSPGNGGSNLLDVSGQAKGISNISISTTTQPIDRYGKRVYIPTRVDFPEVTLTMYDTVDGEIIAMAAKIYEQFFKNNSLSTDAHSIEATISEINSGRKFIEYGSGFHKNFEKVTVHHFFGAFDQNQGKIQKIELINPVVTNISFSPSDYSDGNLRTIDFTMQPENIIFGKIIDSNINEPDWMKEGLEMILESLDVQNSNRNMVKSYIDIASFGKQLGKTKRIFGSGRENTNLLNQFQTETASLPDYGKSSVTDPDFSTTTKRVFGSGRQNTNALQEFDFRTTALENSGDWEDRINSFLESLGYDSASTSYQGQREMAVKAAEAAQLRELSKLHTQLKASQESRDKDAMQESMNKLLEARKSAMPVTASREDSVIGRQDNSSNPYTNDTIYPDVATFNNLGSTPVGLDRYSSGDFADAISKELMSALFNGRKVDIGNVTRSVTQGILGNTLTGDLASLPITSQSKFGIAGDIIRDSIINGTRTNRRNNNPLTNTRVSTTPTTSKTQSQSIINNINSKVRRLR